MMIDTVHIREILDNIALSGLYDRVAWRVFHKGDGFLVQLTYYEADVERPGSPPELQSARKWYVSAHSTDTEIVRTAWKAVLCSLEHRLGEHFTYRGRRVFGPHIDIDALDRIALDIDVRRPM